MAGSSDTRYAVSTDAMALRTLRAAAGLTLRQAAERLGYSISHLSNVERAAKRPSPDLVRAYQNLGHANSGSVPELAVQKAKSTAGGGGLGDDFGMLMMRLRLARGWSLAQLAARTKVSRSYLGNLELGRRRNPSEAVASACDAALGADGALILHAGTRPPAREWQLGTPSAGAYEPDTVQDPELLLDACRAEFTVLRSDAQKRPPGYVLPRLVRGAWSLASKAASMQGSLGQELWLLAARYGEFTGWMYQEADDEGAARCWTDRAAQWALRSGNTDMGGYQWERYSLLALYRADGAATIELARRVAEVRLTSTRVRALAQLREAQGHALLGAHHACQRSLERARTLITHGPAPYPHGSSWGPNTIADDCTLVEAWCLVDLGLHGAAAERFGPNPGQGVPAGATRTRVRFAVRGAVALAAAGRIEQACRLLEGILAEAEQVDSATIRTDLRRVAAVLNRHRRYSLVRAVLPDLHHALRSHWIEGE